MSFGGRQTHEIELKARDGASNVFRAIGREGQRSMEQIDTAAKRTGRSMADARKAGADLAIGVGALAGAFTLAARAAAEEEATFRRLETAVEATGASYDQYAKQIDTAVSAGERLSFADDQVADALARMIGITGDAAASLDAMGVAMDFARLRNIDLSTSADLIGKALAGNTTALSRYGVVIEEGATATEILAAIQAKAAGQAEAYANTTQGGIERVRNSIDNYIESIGAWSGVTGQALATASEFTVQMAIMGVGIGKTAQGIRGLAGAAGIAGLATGPVGLGVLAAAAIAAGAAFLIMRDDASALEKGLALAQDASASLRTEIDQLAAAGDSFALIADALGIKMEALGGGIKTAAATDIPILTDALALAEDGLTQLEAKRAILTSGMGATASEIMALDRQIIDQAALVGVLSDELAAAEGSVGTFANAELALAAIFDHAGVGAERARDTAVALFKAYDEGRISREQLNASIIDVGENLAHFDRLAIAAAAGTDTLTASSRSATGAQNDLNDAVAESNSILGDFIGIVRDAGAAIGDAAVEQGTGDKIASWLGLPPDWRARLKDMQEERQKAAQPPALVSGAKEVTATIITPTMGAPDPTIITFYTDVERAFVNIGRGALTASEALTVFKATQDGLLGSQDVYNAQLSEYTGQLNAITAAVDQIQAKQEAGIEISAREQAVLDGSTAAVERLTGGVEDATLARAELAIQYAENMRIGDQLNQNLATQSQVTGQLVGIVTALILALNGVPRDVKTEVSLLGAQDALNTAASLSNVLANIPTYKRIEIATALTGPVGLAGLANAGIYLQHGGLLPAQHGRLLAHEALVGEAGPEILSGRMVVPNAATEVALRDRGSSASETFAFYAPVYINTNSPRDFAAQMRSYAIGGGRP